MQICLSRLSLFDGLLASLGDAGRPRHCFAFCVCSSVLSFFSLTFFNIIRRISSISIIISASVLHHPGCKAAATSAAQCNGPRWKAAVRHGTEKVAKKTVLQQQQFKRPHSLLSHSLTFAWLLMFCLGTASVSHSVTVCSVKKKLKLSCCILLLPSGCLKTSGRLKTW